MKQILPYLLLLAVLPAFAQKNTKLVNSLNSYTQNTLARLQDKDSILLHYESSACLDFIEADIIIIRNKDQFVAQLYWSYMDRTKLLNEKSQSDTTPIIRTVILTNRQIKAFVRFENELLKITPIIEQTKLENGLLVTVEHTCTTTDSYTVKSKYFSIDKIDRSCKWEGFDRLEVALFGRLY